MRGRHPVLSRAGKSRPARPRKHLAPRKFLVVRSRDVQRYHGHQGKSRIRLGLRAGPERTDQTLGEIPETQPNEARQLDLEGQMRWSAAELRLPQAWQAMAYHERS